MTDIQELERRVTALEAAHTDSTQTLRWVVSKLGRIAAVQDEHTLQLDGLRTDLVALRRDMPGMMPDVMREVLKETKAGA